MYNYTNKWCIEYFTCIYFYLDFLQMLFVLSLVLIPWLFILNLLIPHATHCSLVYLCQSKSYLYQSKKINKPVIFGLVKGNIGLARTGRYWITAKITQPVLLVNTQRTKGITGSKDVFLYTCIGMLTVYSL